MTTAQQVFEWTMDLIDERSDDGTINESDTASYSAKTPGILSILQSELIKQGDIFKTYEIANQPVENLLDDDHQMISFNGSEMIFEAKKAAKAYYFDVDRVGTVYVEDFTDQWNTLVTVTTVNTPDGFTAYKGVVTPTAGASKSRLRFTGMYYYRTLNRALYSLSYASDDDVPDNRVWIKKTMPADFKSVHEIVLENPIHSYLKGSLYKWEGRNKLYIRSSYEGNIRIIYRPVPSIITSLNDELQVDDVTAKTILPYGLAAHLMLQENPDVASYYSQRFEELTFKASKQPPAAFESIENVYGGFN